VDPRPARIHRQQYVYRRRSGLGTATLELRSSASVHTQGSKCPGSLPVYDRALCPVSSILSTPGHVLGIRPKPNLLILIFRRDVRGASGSDSFHVVSLVIGVLNPIIPLQRQLVIRVDLAKMLIDALPDFWPKLGLHMGLQVKLGMQS
ncbi:hypothetical protein Tco_0373684, partial [Tanacetum coccineum]